MNGRRLLDLLRRVLARWEARPALTHGFRIAFYVLAGTAASGVVLTPLLIEPQSSREPGTGEGPIAVDSQYTPVCRETAA